MSWRAGGASLRASKLFCRPAEHSRRKRHSPSIAVYEITPVTSRRTTWWSGRELMALRALRIQPTEALRAE
ncbi:MAG: hypothetical protein ACRELT_09420 [Longimicrobiales bacterium]